MHHYGHATFINKNTIQVGDKQFTAPHIIVATGGKPTVPTETPGHEYGITSDYFFDDMKFLPKKVAVVGAGYIAIELAGILGALGKLNIFFEELTF